MGITGYSYAWIKAALFAALLNASIRRGGVVCRACCRCGVVCVVAAVKQQLQT